MAITPTRTRRLASGLAAAGLLLGGLGLVSAAFGATGVTWQRTVSFAPAGGRVLSEPEVLRSADGSLKAELTAARGRVRIAGAERRHRIRLWV